MMIPHSRLSISAADSEAVAQVVSSGVIAQGRLVRQFEEEVASYIGVKGGVAVSSGTTALHVALLAMGVGANDEVILPSYLCVAPLNAVNYTGATAILADVDHNGNISAAAVRQMITPRTKVIIVPHMMGYPAELDDLKNLGVPILEDCAQSIGAKYKGGMTGSFGRASICSFYATKVFACGEGGMVLSNDEALLAAARDLRDYDEKTPYRIRYNYKMTDIQAALGLSQLQRLPQFIEVRQQIAARFNSAFTNLPASLPLRAEGIEPIYFRYILRFAKGSNDFIDQMEARGVVCRKTIYKPLHQLLNQPRQELTEKLYKECVSIPIYPTLQETEREQIINCVKEILTG